MAAPTSRHSRSRLVAASIGAGCCFVSGSQLFVATPGTINTIRVQRGEAASPNGVAGVAASPSDHGALVSSAGLLASAAVAASLARRQNQRAKLARTAEGSAEAASPAKEDAAAPAKEEPAVPAKEEAEAPAKEEAAAPAKEEPAAPAKEEAPAPAETAPEEKKAPPEPVKEETGFQWSKQIGVVAPVGFFDPAGFTKGKGEDLFREYRTAELKHGRVAMMAAVGAVAQHFFTFPGFDDVPRGLGAPFTLQGFIGLGALGAAAYALETGPWKQDPAKEVGDFGDPAGIMKMGWGEYDDDMRNKEVNNGRFAMIAIMGILVAENETGKDGIEQIFGI